MAVELKGVCFTYLPGSPAARQVLRGIELELRGGEILCLMGVTGAGKSTLLQIMAGLLPPTDGEVLLEGKPSGTRGGWGRDLRAAVKLLMQSPERQLFADTVRRDVGFGPRNQGLSGDELDARVRESLLCLDLDPDVYLDRSPFHLSEGEKRRVALAGVLAMRPGYLLLDEPSSGLDPPGRDQLHRHMLALRGEGKGIFMVTHDWEEVEALADRVALLKRGNLSRCGAREEVTSAVDDIVEAGLRPPPLVEVLSELRRRGVEVPISARGPRETAAVIASAMKGVR